VTGAVCALAGGGGGAVQVVASATISETALDPADATANVSFGTDGACSTASDLGSLADWWTRAPIVGIGASYWIRCTVNSGSVTGSATGSWLQLNSVRSWGITRTVIGTATANLTIAIASDAAGANILASDTFNLSAIVDS
jgi:hypothetical protein